MQNKSEANAVTDYYLLIGEIKLKMSKNNSTKLAIKPKKLDFEKLK